jgi:hypothetical protein
MLGLEVACNGDMDRAMKVVVRDHKRGGKHYVIGEFETKMQRFVDAKNEGGNQGEEAAFTLRKGDKKTGNILVLQASILADKSANWDKESASTERGQATLPETPRQSRPEFVDYLTGGCQISLAVAIDFTASNGKLLRRFSYVLVTVCVHC